jgi:hypothetical protein
MYTSLRLKSLNFVAANYLTKHSHEVLRYLQNRISVGLVRTQYGYLVN